MTHSGLASPSYRRWAVHFALTVISAAMLLSLPSLLLHRSSSPQIMDRYDLDYFLVVVAYAGSLLGVLALTGIFFKSTETLDRWLIRTAHIRQNFTLISILIASLWIFWLFPFTWNRGYSAVENIEDAAAVIVYALTILLAFLYEAKHSSPEQPNVSQSTRRIALIVLGFLCFSAAFIYQTSFIALDGQRYFSLFDDAMISMRFAWNLANGDGLVWNVGEYVEGYTNLLMTLLMAAANWLFKFDKRYAVLSIQLIGIPTALGIAFVLAKTTDFIRDEFNLPEQAFFKPLVFFAALAYYPLVYFSLTGMETGLVTLLLLLGTLRAFQYVEQRRLSQYVTLPLVLGLAYLTRPDSLICAALILGYVAYEMLRAALNLQTLLKAGGLGLLYLILPVLQQLFRVSYYGDVVPNTYVLKMTGMPTGIRVLNGFNFIQPFLWNALPLFFIVIVGIILRPSRKGLLLLAIPFTLIAYQIWVGGDVWNYWRMVAPGIPFLMLLLAALVFHISQRFLNEHFSYGLISATILVAALFHINTAFLPEISFRVRPYDYLHNRRNVNIAVALNDLTTSSATIGVFSAGSVPYYLDRYAIDFLGKSDRYIARLDPDLSGAMAKNRMTSLPGHNKYDLYYSISELKPTYVMSLKWGEDDLTEWAKDYYVLVDYQGVKLYLLKDSESVRWELIDTQDQ